MLEPGKPYLICTARLQLSSMTLAGAFARIQFSDLPEKWVALLRTASTIKYEIVPIQAHQIDLISNRITFFNQLSKHFRQEFKQKRVSAKETILSCTSFDFIWYSLFFGCFSSS